MNKRSSREDSRVNAAIGAAVAILVVAGAASAQDTGEQIYEDNCAVCHQAEGEGVPPAFPALSGNDNLADVQLIVRNIHQGQGNMPPFPDLTAEEVAAVASYIRTSWQNSFGEVPADEVAAAMDGMDGIQQASVWSGVYTGAQAERGLQAYAGRCGVCHGSRLNGAPDDADMRSSPPLARAKFLREWEGRSLASLFEYTRATMPLSNPGSMTDQQYIDIIAHMLSVSEIPAGEEELSTDPQELARFVIEQEP